MAESERILKPKVVDFSVLGRSILIYSSSLAKVDSLVSWDQNNVHESAQVFLHENFNKWITVGVLEEL